MSLLSPRLQLRVAQKQILTPGLVQMVTVLQLNRLELRDMISQEINQNPVLEESAEAGDELTPEEVHELLERERQAESVRFSVCWTQWATAAAAPALDSDFPEPVAEVALESGATASAERPDAGSSGALNPIRSVR